MKKYFVKSLFFVFLFSSTLQSCKDDDCPDQCDGVADINANFHTSNTYHVSNMKRNETRKFFTDVFQVPATITFDSLDDQADSVWWTIGNDPRVFRGKSQELDFSKATGDLDITVIVAKKSHLNCFPNSQSKDTVSRTIRLNPFGSAPIYGKCLGSNVGEASTFTISIDTFYDPDAKTVLSRVQNLPEGENYLQVYATVGWNSLYFFKDGSPHTDGYATFDEKTKQIMVEYSYQIGWDSETNSPINTTKTFVGIKNN